MKWKKNKVNIYKLHARRQEWRWHNINAICLTFYYVNDENDIKERSPQIMQFEFFVTIGLWIYLIQVLKKEKSNNIS
jgi:hypothetical protein